MDTLQCVGCIVRWTAQVVRLAGYVIGHILWWRVRG